MALLFDFYKKRYIFASMSSKFEQQGRYIIQNGQKYDLFDLPRGFVIYGDITLSGLVDGTLPDMSDVVVMGRFACAGAMLSSLRGAPRFVMRDFNCSDNRLTDLKYITQDIRGGIICSNNRLGTLSGVQRSVAGDFICSNNDLGTLKGGPDIVLGDFVCSDNKLSDLNGGPQYVNKWYVCSRNQLVSLAGAPHSIGGGVFDCSNNRLVSMDGSPRYVSDAAIYSDNYISDLRGAPAVVGTQVVCKNNPIVSLAGGANMRFGVSFECDLHSEYTVAPVELLAIRSSSFGSIAHNLLKCVLQPAGSHYNKRRDVITTWHQLTDAKSLKNIVNKQLCSREY